MGRLKGRLWGYFDLGQDEKGAIMNRGITELVRVCKQQPCPICGKSDWCRVHRSGAYAICNRVQSDRPAKSNGWVHILGSGAGRLPRPPAPQPEMPDVPMAPLRLRDATYRRLLTLLGLSDLHRRALRRRGMTDAEIEARGYASMPLRGRAEACRQLTTQGFTLAGVPGFYRKQDNGQNWWTLAGRPGLLIPVRDSEGRIHGLQIRHDGNASPRYAWLSSAGRPGGAGSGSPVHVSRPDTLRDPRLWLTEGPLKADVAAERLGAVVIAVPGVASWREGLMAAREMPGKATELVIAFDMDAQKNPHVERYRADLILAAFEESWRVKAALWPDTFKGLDDALVAGAEIQLVNPFRDSNVRLPQYPIYEGAPL